MTAIDSPNYWTIEREARKWINDKANWEKWEHSMAFRPWRIFAHGWWRAHILVTNLTKKEYTTKGVLRWLVIRRSA